MSAATEPRGLPKALLVANAWLVYAFFYVPIFVLIIFSFSDDKLVGRWGG